MSSKLRDLASGFTRTFWVANVLELFERFAFYGSKAVLTVYLVERVGLGALMAASLAGVFASVLYFLPILAGTVVDRYGFKRSLAACFTIFCVGYFLIGLAGLQFGQSIVAAVGRFPYIVAVLMLTAIGGSLIKPSIVGTVARTTTPDTKALGYSIYYTLVNIGGAMGPILALQVRQSLGIEYVLVVSSITSAFCLLGTLLFFREPERAPGEAVPTSFGKVLRDMALVFRNGRFMSFLVIFSGFWIMFWQIFYSLPFYLKDMLHYEPYPLVQSVGPWTIILTTVPAAALARRLPAIGAMTLGFAISSTSWFVMALVPTVEGAIAAVAIMALGEAIQAPRYYGYVADLAPRDQVGTYMGIAFLPIAIGTFGAGLIAGRLVEAYAPAPQPSHMWFVIGGIGVVS